MLRPKKFRPLEITVLFAIALLLLGAGVVGEVLAFQRSDLRLGLASLGAFVLAAIYLYAARRGRPL